MIIHFQITVGLTCKHCNADFPLLEEASMHKCLKNKDIYMENNVLFTNESNDNLDVNDERKFI